MADYNELLELLRGHNIIIQTHNFPDPDAIGSAFGLKKFLAANGIDSKLAYDGKIDKNTTKRMIEMFNIDISAIDSLEGITEEDYVITVDGQKLNSNFTDMTGDEIACIDHHPWTTDYVYKYVDHRICGACCSMIANYFMESGIDPDNETATALLFGLKMDTANFSRGVTDFDITAFGFLHKLADDEKINQLINSNIELSDLKAYGMAFENIVVYDKIGFSHINLDCPDALVAMVSDFILSLEAVDVSVIYADRNGGYKFSIRSEIPAINAGKLAKAALAGYGEGGGHSTMAGCLMSEENRKKLGKHADFTIRKLFMDEINRMMKEN